MKKFLIVLMIIVIILAIVMIFLPDIIFPLIFGKPKRSTKVPKYYVDTPHYKVSRAGMAYMKTIPCEDVYITSRDGLKLHAYLFPAEGENKNFVLGIHGYKSYARPEFGPYIEFYRSRGYSMLLPDDRSHAPSEGNYIGFGVLDRLDCVDWAKYIVKQYGEDTKILLHGVSMGGATVLSASGEEDLPTQVIGTVADCGYSSTYEILKYQLNTMAKGLPVNYIIKNMERICKKRIGYDFKSVTAINQVQKAKVPIMFVQGGKDTMVPSYMADELYEACTSRKCILRVPEAGHAESIAFEKEKYQNMIIEFFGV